MKSTQSRKPPDYRAKRGNHERSESIPDGEVQQADIDITFSIVCGCHCVYCGFGVRLEGVSDPFGTHYCPRCDNFVGVNERSCNERTEARVWEREKEAQKHV